MSARIHATAIIARDAQLGDGVEIGPFAIIGEGCVVGDECVIGARTTLERHVILASNVRVGSGTILGGDPQDLKYKGEHTTVEIGEGTTIREYSTINRGTSQSFKTTVGKQCFIMSYVHLAHDCHIGDGVILGNTVQLAGHVTIDDKAIVSGQSAVHQFVQIGRYSFTGGCSRVSKDVPPYVKANGNPIRLYGLNKVGLQRNGVSEDVQRELKRAYRLFFNSDLNLSQARERAEEELQRYPEVEEFLSFLDRSDRGLVI
ncbi:MAG TPA: acyl-ACP--UDP-N-acetylglucosamine O-acyltransferase [Gemmatimonadaceae bacterium]|jgi:UDP-N-acetylglucosamine acyltransferase|nr:acyl-ACP--UDP-N-acetylglucosamine O-acyltransferase [Gemmatimonadaceae bacterium]